MSAEYIFHVTKGTQPIETCNDPWKPAPHTYIDAFYAQYMGDTRGSSTHSSNCSYASQHRKYPKTHYVSWFVVTKCQIKRIALLD